MTKSSAYILTAYSFITSQKLDKLLDTGYGSREGSPIPSFDENILITLCRDAQQIFEKEDNILSLDDDFIIVGDIHGSLHDLLRILKFIQESNSKVLFLGDYVDRGNFSLECVTILFALKIMHPNNFYLIRGNHEFDVLCSQYGFKKEILEYHNPKKSKTPKVPSIEKHIQSDFLKFNFESEEKQEIDEENTKDDKLNEYYSNHKDMNCYKYSEKLYEAFIQAFSYLPLAAIVNQTNFCIHGGLSPRFESVNQIQNCIQRPITNFEDNKLLSDVLWSDPATNYTTLFGDNPRGRGYLFNMDAVFNFLSTNSLKRLIRAHQCVKNGMHTQFNEKCITIFSASSYDQDMYNSSGVLKLFMNNNKVQFISFPPISRLEKSDASYYKVQAFNEETGRVPVCFSLLHPKLNPNEAVRMVTNVHSRKIKEHQSLRVKKPLSRSNSRLNNQVICKPPIFHSVSMNNFNSMGINCKEKKEMKRNNNSFDDITNL